MSRRALLLGGAGAVVLAATPGTAGQRNARVRVPTRVGTWSAAVTAQAPKLVYSLTGQTVRQVVHTSVGGDRPQVRFSNAFGTTPVRVGAASLGLRGGTGPSTATVPGTLQKLTFAGRPDAVIPAGGTLLSDAAPLIVPPGADLVISLYLPEKTEVGTLTPRAYQANVVADGDVTGQDDPGGEPFATYLFLTGVSVRARRSTSAIVAFGDSITRGAQTVESANHRWPDLLAARLRAGDADRAVLNAGISGNRLLAGPFGRTGRAGSNAWSGEAGVRRFDRDVLAQPGVSHVIVLIGVNDFGTASKAGTGALIAGHRQLIARGKDAGLTMIGGTLLPFGGYRATFDTPETRAKREAFNSWVRTSGEYDGFVDFDAAVRDPDAPYRMRAAFDSGDHLHPNDAGMAALANAVPLELFE
ncbi:SGNH hydrolase [Actinoplanes sp. OR16]|uniref:SGNH/GDSL hydrolase family protein n=1 Tax=Actinoplanes sp. OR16 TaxID=946334 RepID=UPI000F720F7A|nr:SGNH/GDSL hydrolase family protein [Actinoplanes sp. OR16]BBH70929.1 SGNH hydrolase [Actinoplanes sp. OR16]